MLFGGLGLSLLMTADNRLASTTRWKTGGLFGAYAVILMLLYGGCSSSVACRPLFVMWQNLGDRLGRDFVGFLWQLSGFAGFTISASGTTSAR
jgi:hypothetical protein